MRPMYTLSLVLTSFGTIHATLADSGTPMRDIGEAMPGEAFFVRAFAKRAEAEEALAGVTMALARLAEIGLLGATPGRAVVRLMTEEAVRRSFDVPVATTGSVVH